MSAGLKKLNRLIGTWRASDPSGAGAIQGEVTFEWMEGGYFLLQHVDLDGRKGIEIIRYDEESKTLKSYYFSNTGKILEYEYEIDEDTIMISIDMPEAKGDFVGTFSDDDSMYTGSWEWSQNGVLMGYDVTMTRVKEVDDSPKKAQGRVPAIGVLPILALRGSLHQSFPENAQPGSAK